ncbi:MAG: PQQ-binding-like beta-propeller repeat protein [Verrucomicrobiota bacterium]
MPVCRADFAITSPDARFPTRNTGLSNTYGWEFTVGTRDLLVIAVGIWDMNLAGLSSPHPVGIWNGARELVVSELVKPGTEVRLTDGFRMEDLSEPVRLVHGTTYTIGAFYAGDDWLIASGLVGPTVSPAISNLQPLFAFGEALTVPDRTELAGGHPQPYAGPTFEFLPLEEGSWFFDKLGFGTTAPGIGPDGTIYVSSPGALDALHADGRLRWRFDVPGGLFLGGTPCIGPDGRVYFGATSFGLGGDQFYALDSNGARLWTLAEVGLQNVSPALASDGTVYMVEGGPTHRLDAVDPNGSIRWKYGAGGGRDRDFSSPVVGPDGTIYTSVEDTNLFSEFVAITPKGETRWRTPLAKIYNAAALDSNGVLYAAGHDGRLYALKTDDGRVIWQSAQIRGDLDGSPVIGTDGAVYVGSSGGFYAFAADTGLIRWGLETKAGAVSTAAIASDGTVCFGDQAGRLFGLAPEDGSARWSFETGGRMSFGGGTTIGPDGVIYFDVGTRLYALAGHAPLATTPWPIFRGNVRHTGAYLSYYGDGIPDIWRRQYFGAGFATDPRALAVADPDADGANNFQEYLHSTDPLDTRSVDLKAPPLLVIEPGEKLFTNAVTILPRTTVPQGTVHYTATGATPTASSPVLSEPILLTGTTTIRARVFVDQTPVSEIVESRYVETVASPGSELAFVTTAAATQLVRERGAAAEAGFAQPRGIAAGNDGALYIADAGDHSIRKLTLIPSGVTTIAGDGTAGFLDGPASSARFRNPHGLCVAGNGAVYIADSENNRIRKISADGRTVTTVAGSGLRGYLDGPAAAAQFDFPEDVVIDPRGNLFITEFNNHTVRMVTPGGEVETIAGNGHPGFQDGIGPAAGLNYPAGLAIDAQRTLYVAEWGSHRIRRILADGTVSELAGSIFPGRLDGTGGAARFNHPQGIAWDPSGALLVSEEENHTLRRVALDGSVLTLAGTGEAGYVDGPGRTARFSAPMGVAVNVEGQVFVSDSANHRIRKVLVLRPEIIHSPEAKSVTSGGEVTWSAAAVGAEPLTYQWRYNGVPLLGATGKELALRDLLPAASGTYSLFVSNLLGTAISPPALLTVLPIPSRAVRELPAEYVPGHTIQVRLEIHPTAGVSAYVVEEVPPRGWKAGILPVGSYDSTTGHIKFGPFFDGLPRTITYELTAPLEAANSIEFLGLVSLDGQSIPITGPHTVAPIPTTFPADRSPADFHLSADELTAYAAAWRKGQDWPNPPNPIPIAFVTRAGALWKTGEWYVWEPSIDGPPLWWLSKSPPALAGSLASGPIAGAERQSAGTFVAGLPLPVRIVVTLPAGVMAYALEESVPDGGMVEGISEGGTYDSVHQLIKFGPFFGQATIELRYALTMPSNAPTSIVLNGIFSYDGTDALVTGRHELGRVVQSGSLQRLSPERFGLPVIGSPDAVFHVRVSSDLKNWRTLAEVLSTNGWLDFVDPAAATAPQRFYAPMLPAAAP